MLDFRLVLPDRLIRPSDDTGPNFLNKHFINIPLKFKLLNSLY